MAKATILGQEIYDRRLKLTHTKGVTEGDIIVSSGHVLVAAHQANAGVEAQYIFRGPVMFAKSADVAFKAGEVCYFDESRGHVNKTSSNNIKIGICLEAVAKETNTVLVQLRENT